MLKSLFLLICLAFSVSPLKGSNSDSLNILHYNIHIDTLDSVVDTLAAHTEVILKPLYPNTNQFTLDLLELNIDSIKVDGGPCTWTYNDTLLRISTPGMYGPADTLSIMVWYNGVPQMDGSSWGGFYLNNPLYAYNLGVGFDADPHTYGRVWFPCKDNFTDKATYDFYVETTPSKIAVCNGTLIGSTTGADGNITWHWNMSSLTCTYLVSVAVSDYIALTDEFISITGDTIPIAIYVRAVDSADAVGSFQNLQAVLAAFENLFGPYRLERIGFVGVPFNSGAMEHATNIAYPIFTLNGTTTYETLWGHELSHMWFGDLVTCSNAEDMWLNEGFASFCEALMTEALYDTVAYKNYVRNNHAKVLRTAHIDDGGYRAVSGVPHQYTYGTTVYSKGASVAHSLRNYMGQHEFFDGIKSYLSVHGFKNATSDTLKNQLEISSGQQLDDFFASWVYQPGFTHYSVDSFEVSGTGPYTVNVYLRQRLRGTSTLYNSNRVEVTFMDSDRNMETQLANFSGASAMVTMTVQLNPVTAMVDIEERLADATTDNYQHIASTGMKTFPTTYFSADVQSVSDTAFLRATHNWVAPDSFLSAHPGILLNDERYWTVEGNFPPGFHSKGKFDYNGSASAYLDAGWINNSEDSIVIFHRIHAGMEWQEVTGYTRSTGASLTDKIGSILVDTLKPGEYALGIYDNFTSAEIGQLSIPFSIHPNPTSEEITLFLPEAEGYQVKLQDLSGKVLSQFKVAEGVNEYKWNVNGIASGIYLVTVKTKKGKTGVSRIVIE